MRLLICGDRNWTDAKVIKEEILRLKPKVLIQGEARGADTIARIAAEQIGSIAIISFFANWRVYGRRAGMIRNQDMLDYGKPDFVLAFHDNISISRGTKHMVRIARAKEIPIEVWSHNAFSSPLV